MGIDRRLILLYTMLCTIFFNNRALIISPRITWFYIIPRYAVHRTILLSQRGPVIMVPAVFISFINYSLRTNAKNLVLRTQIYQCMSILKCLNNIQEAYNQSKM